MAWCSRIWQWYIHWPGRSSGSHAIRSRLFFGTLTVSSQETTGGGPPPTSRSRDKKTVEVERGGVPAFFSRRAPCDRKFDALAGCNKSLRCLTRLGQQAAVCADDRERPRANGEPDVHGVGRVHDPPAFDLTARDL